MFLILLLLILSCFLFCFFFFFKQKTAYEMRISDWSSDVCSSDLARERDDVLRPDGSCPVARLHALRFRALETGNRSLFLQEELGVRAAAAGLCALAGARRDAARHQPQQRPIPPAG